MGAGYFFKHKCFNYSYRKIAKPTTPDPSSGENHHLSELTPSKLTLVKPSSKVQNSVHQSAHLSSDQNHELLPKSTENNIKVNTSTPTNNKTRQLVNTIPNSIQNSKQNSTKNTIAKSTFSSPTISGIPVTSNTVTVDPKAPAGTNFTKKAVTDSEDDHHPKITYQPKPPPIPYDDNDSDDDDGPILWREENPDSDVEEEEGEDEEQEQPSGWVARLADLQRNDTTARGTAVASTAVIQSQQQNYQHNVQNQQNMPYYHPASNNASSHTAHSHQNHQNNQNLQNHDQNSYPAYRPNFPSQEPDSIASSTQNHLLSQYDYKNQLQLPVLLQNNHNSKNNTKNTKDKHSKNKDSKSKDSKSKESKSKNKESKLKRNPDASFRVPNPQDEHIKTHLSRKESQRRRQEVSGILTRRLSQRPSQDDLQDRNIFRNRKSDKEIKTERESIKRELSRKLSIRPSIQELIEKRIIFNQYVDIYDIDHYWKELKLNSFKMWCFSACFRYC